MNIKDSFVENYLRFKENFNAKRLLYLPFYQKQYEQCLILEQYNLNCILKNEIKPTFVLHFNKKNKASDYATKIGYTHLAGNVKYAQNIISKIHFRFENEFKKEYLHLKKILND